MAEEVGCRRELPAAIARARPGLVTCSLADNEAGRDMQEDMHDKWGMGLACQDAPL